MISAREFAEFVKQRAKAKDGYIMGARGQDPKKWSKSSWWFTQYKSAKQRQKALYWRANAERVWDCQGMAEGFINDKTGSNIDVRARNNYSSWCSPKGGGMIPVEHRKRGAAVFWGKTAGAISHVAFLIEPVEAGNVAGDWIIGEARGVMHGVVLTRLYERKPNYWGLMTRYFEYEDEKPLELGDRELSYGDAGEDVREVQSMLIELDFDCGKWGADGEFGKATKGAVVAFQKAYHLEQTGKVGAETLAALIDIFKHEDEPPDSEPKPLKLDAIDLSYHNSSSFTQFDWDKIKNGVSFLILRAGITQVEKQPLGINADYTLIQYAKKCEKYGIPYWVYYYGNFDRTPFAIAKGDSKEVKARKNCEKRLFAVQHAAKEARFLWEHCNEHGLNPIGYAYDVEQPDLDVVTFFDTLRDLGAKKTMLYIGNNWVPIYKLPTDDNGFISCADAVWIPRYGYNTGQIDMNFTPIYPHDMWQFSSVMAFDGIPDKTLDGNAVTWQRRPLEWFMTKEG
jgi:peptidoglycan hydrolase-like protein with peptidoglycan-binding domain